MKLTVRIISGFLIAIGFYLVLMFSGAPQFVSLLAPTLTFFGFLIFTSKGFQRKMEENRMSENELREKKRVRENELREIQEEEIAKETGKLIAQGKYDESSKSKNPLEGLGSSPLADEMLGKKRNKK